MSLSFSPIYLSRFTWSLPVLKAALRSSFFLLVFLQTALANESTDQAIELPSLDNQENQLSPPEEPTEGDLSFWQRGADWFIENRQSLSNRVDTMARGIDRFFAGDEALDDENKSFARVRFSNIVTEGDGYSSVGELKLRLRLPATQKRFRLVIENDPDEQETLEGRSRPSTTDEDSTEQNRFYAALQIVNGEMENWKRKGEIGIRADIPLDPFVRHTATRRWALDENWSVRFRQRLAYYNNDGYRGSETLRFERTINDHWFYRMATEVEWRETEDTMTAAQAFSFFHRLDDTKGFEYRFGTIAESLHHTVIDKSYLAIDYRQLLYDDWLYLDVIPEVEFPREDDYDSITSLTVRLEVLFFK